uniref:Uncharacterized protein n=1 Tax=Aplanochytrium stocchinoi TaxID=215587 RepID=A0A7S3PMJ0_9STRA|mmetsp:Transcript_12543/g.15571  ORF Transcript_12543/g.15571 Transcript_12543/m.15571 type:complete len:218 (-) Transcript_12543:260-913(-)|eukprot:CAMPEP_0204842120 /NCGR_PEP_ID=MMETSP1346-20131115/44802_1 /ASSEMBLY_ACC=CAM_ASM_000771 /TAXON_ID=215587 /ORGANISM="Aplanochytrium stocchinoi, Strain GSBS06" /LENGTH=217 /DNA_ID=CAMNT_0051980689 /DNA_START=354 /DNA_END=1007 /DNA_ORIENTATION=+
MKCPYKRPRPRPNGKEDGFIGYSYDSKRPHFELCNHDYSLPVQKQKRVRSQDFNQQHHQVLKRKLPPETQVEVVSNSDFPFIKKRARLRKYRSESENGNGKDVIMDDENEEDNYVRVNKVDSKSNSANESRKQSLDLVPIGLTIQRPLPDPMYFLSTPRNNINTLNVNLNMNNLRDQTPAPASTQLILWNPPEQVVKATFPDSGSSHSSDSDPMDLA